MIVPLGITARNEERAIEACLESLLRAVAEAEAMLPLEFDVVVVLDECVDRTGEIARSFERVRTIESRGGIVEAQRKLADSAPWVIFSDADIVIEPQTLAAVSSAMLERPDAQVAYPTKSPLEPRRRTWLARALYTYNRFDGFQTRRRYFNGKLFAIRDWAIPTLEELEPRLERLKPDRFYNFHAGMIVDDIYLSRDLLRRSGPDAILEVADARIWYRPPETFAGMYRTYRRMRMEIERIDALFPETRPTHREHGVRRYDRDAAGRARCRDRWLWRWFRVALGVCKVRYVLERFYYRHLSKEICPQWQPVEESKVAAASG